jgi:hypothetical protein
VEFDVYTHRRCVHSSECRSPLRHLILQYRQYVSCEYRIVSSIPATPGAQHFPAYNVLRSFPCRPDHMLFDVLHQPCIHNANTPYLFGAYRQVHLADVADVSIGHIPGVGLQPQNKIVTRQASMSGFLTCSLLWRNVTQICMTFSHYDGVRTCGWLRMISLAVESTSSTERRGNSAQARIRVMPIQAHRRRRADLTCCS